MEAITVWQFNEMIDVTLRTIGVIDVVGEITEKRISKNSGLMMTIKDPDGKSAILKLSGFAPRVKGVNEVEVGMKIVASGVPSLYSPYGSFALQVVSLTPFGTGSLNQAFEKLKKLLETKGYFAVERKRSLPEVITKIVLVTADESAALTDFLKILKENEIGLDIDFYPVSVQGKNAVDEIVAVLGSIQEQQVDVVVLTRGGGGLEDLIAFNDEMVAEAIFACKSPVLSAVGHERDTSIADMVADVVASTPSQAAYYLANINSTFLENFQKQKMDMLLRLEMDLGKLDYVPNLNMMKNAIEMKYVSYRKGLDKYESLLHSYSPKEVLRRGYSLVRKGDKLIKSVKDVSAKDALKIDLSDGVIEARVI